MISINTANDDNFETDIRDGKVVVRLTDNRGNTVAVSLDKEELQIVNYAMQQQTFKLTPAPDGMPW